MKNILFVCSLGRIRSRTAEVITMVGDLGKNFDCRSCGTEINLSGCMTPISNNLLYWADQIICMENKHLNEISFLIGSEGKEVFLLDIEDTAGTQSHCGIYDPFDYELQNNLIQKISLFNSELSIAMQNGVQRRLEAGIPVKKSFLSTELSIF